MKSIKQLADLFLYQVQNMYASQEQILQSFPLIINNARHSSLKNALKHYLTIKEEQKKRLMAIQRSVVPVNAGASEAYGKGVKGLIEETLDLLAMEMDKEIADAALISSVQTIIQYEICNCSLAYSYAFKMSEDKAKKLLQKILEEEQDTSDLLKQLAAIVFPKEATIKIEEATSLTSSKKKQPKDWYENNETEEDFNGSSTEEIQSPGGRAGTSHRAYSDGESRGH